MKQWTSHLPGFSAEAACVKSTTLYGSATSASGLHARKAVVQPNMSSAEAQARSFACAAVRSMCMHTNNPLQCIRDKGC